MIKSAQRIEQLHTTSAKQASTPSARVAIALLRDDCDNERHQRVIRISEQLLHHHPESAEIWYLRGKSLQALQLFELALAAYQRAAALGEYSAELGLAQAICFERVGDHHLALQHYEQALADERQFLSACHGLLNLRTVKPDDPIAQSLRAVAESSQASTDQRAFSHFLLGRVLVDAGHYDEGFRHYLKGNTLLPHLKDDGSEDFPSIEEFALFSKGFYERYRRSEALPHCPAVMVAGLPRAGKSLTEHLICDGTSAMPGGERGFLRKYINRFGSSRDPAALSKKLLAEADSKLGDQYRKLAMGFVGEEKSLVVDTSPNTLLALAYLPLIHPELPVILCRRSYRDHGIALFFKKFRKGFRYSFSLHTVGKAIAQAENLMDQWLEVLPNPTLLIEYETLANDASAVQKQLHQFLGLTKRVEAPTDVGKGNRANQVTETPLNPGHTLSCVGEIRPALLGFSENFAAHLAPLDEAYHQFRIKPR